MKFVRRPMGSPVPPIPIIPNTAIPTDRPRPGAGYRVASERAAIADAAGSGESTREAIRTSFAVLLSRYSGEATISLSVARGDATSMGYDAFTVDLSGDPQFGMVRDRFSRPEPSASRSGPPSFLIDCSRRPGADPGPGNELCLRVRPSEGGLELVCDYNAELFDAETIRRMLGHLEVLLRAGTADPRTRISSLPILTPAEWRRVVVDWNQPDPSGQAAVNLRHHEIFESQAARRPDATAIISERETLTFRELDERSNRFANYLRDRGAGPDVLVAIHLERSPELIVGILGILKAGAAYLPLDAGLPPGRLSDLIALAGPSLLVTDSRLHREPAHGSARVILVDRERRDIDAEPPTRTGVRVSPDDLATVVFTSGTTGTPKAVPRPHRWFRFIEWTRSTFELSEDSRHVLKTSLDSTLLARELFWPLLTGSTMVIAGRSEANDAAGLARLLKRHRITHLTLVPSLLRLFLEEPDFASCDSLRHVSCFGEHLSSELEDRFRRTLGADLSSVYGTTEATMLTFRMSREGGSRPMGNLGYRHGAAEVYILDEHRRPVPIGIPGELYAGGPSVAGGYLNRDRESERLFISHPFREDPQARLYRTGDRARWRPDGSLEYLGRCDDQIKIRGFRIEPSEVEAALARHPAVREVAVGARPNRLGENQLVAYVVLRENRPTASELREYLSELLPSHSVPGIFAVASELPRTPNGKVDRRSLADLELERLGCDGESVGPRNPVEEAMAEIWRDVLELGQIGIHENFLDLGGSSLLATRLLGRVKETFGVEVSPSALLESPTVARLTATVQNPDYLPPVLLRLQSGDLAPPFFCFAGSYGTHRMLLGHGVNLASLARKLGEGFPFYGVTPSPLPEGIEPDAVFDRIAAEAIHEIRAARPRGPYCLGGYSLGAMVALEVAGRLIRQGEEVPLLAILDARGPGYPRRRGLLETGWRFLKGLDRELFRNEFAKARRVLGRKLKRPRGGIVPSAAPPGSLGGLTSLAARSYVRSLTNYPGRIELFEAADSARRPWLDYDETSRGWGAIAEGEVLVWPVPGTHITMLTEPAVDGLVEALKARLLAAEQARPRG